MENDFETNVFINCPFDDEFIPLLRPLLFTILYCGLNPRIASERHDSGEVRLHKIAKLIEQSKYSIHDLSRCQAKEEGDHFRMNMALELGLDLGCRYFHPDKSEKLTLITAENRNAYNRAMSDWAHADITQHNNDPEALVEGVRDWLTSSGVAGLHSSTRIWDSFNEMMSDFYTQKKDDGFNERQIQFTLPITEFIEFIKTWLPKG